MLAGSIVSHDNSDTCLHLSSSHVVSEGCASPISNDTQPDDTAAAGTGGEGSFKLVPTHAGPWITVNLAELMARTKHSTDADARPHNKGARQGSDALMADAELSPSLAAESSSEDVDIMTMDDVEDMDDDSAPVSQADRAMASTSDDGSQDVAASRSILLSAIQKRKRDMEQALDDNDVDLLASKVGPLHHILHLLHLYLCSQQACSRTNQQPAILCSSQERVFMTSRIKCLNVAFALCSAFTALHAAIACKPSPHVTACNKS